MKTAISLADKTFQEAEKLAKRLRISRSELYARTLEHFLRAHGEQAEIEAFNRVYEKVDSQLDPALRQAIKRRLEASEW
jgi:metal-responsive CopG/Arc/MetJ family transcriptional regulator